MARNSVAAAAIAGCWSALPIEVMPATQEIVQQFADLLGSISHAASDNAISEDEASKIRHVWDELKRFTEGFVKCCEEGDFANLTRLADTK